MFFNSKGNAPSKMSCMMSGIRPPSDTEKPFRSCSVVNDNLFHKQLNDVLIAQE